MAKPNRYASRSRLQVEINGSTIRGIGSARANQVVEYLQKEIDEKGRRPIVLYDAALGAVLKAKGLI